MIQRFRPLPKAPEPSRPSPYAPTKLSDQGRHRTAWESSVFCSHGRAVVLQMEAVRNDPSQALPLALPLRGDVVEPGRDGGSSCVGDAEQAGR